MKRPVLSVILMSLCAYLPFFAGATGHISLSGGIGNDSIFSSQTICYNTVPMAFTGSIPTGGSGSYTYKWQSSTTSASAGFTTISGATGQGYAPAALTATRWYRRIVTAGASIDTTPAIQVSVTPIITAASNTITAAQSICYNTAPAALNGSSPTGGDGSNYAYTWQSSPDNSSWTTITGALSIGYSPSALTANTWFRRIVSSGGCSHTSASIKISVSPIITNNTVKTDQSICSGQTPLSLTGSTPAGGNAVYAYTWQSSTTSATTGFATASGTTTGINYAPGTLTQTSWFRRVVNSGGCSDSSAAIKITVVNSAPGNPAVYGNNTWNVYAYSDNSFGSYAGFYTEPSLSFITTSRYTSAQSPSSASGYQGCLIPATNFSASMKRTGFTPGTWQLDLSAADDNVVILVNGSQIYTRACCMTPPTTANNIWTGNLTASDLVEIRWTQGTGGAQAGVNFTMVTPAPLNPGSIGNNQSVCYGDAPAAGFVSTAAPSGGCTYTGYQWQSSVDSSTWTNISGATALTYTVASPMTQTTWYRRVISDACSNSAATLPVKITVNVIAPGDPSVFGDNVWNAYAFTYPAGNTNFSAATYKGFYTEPSLSFNSTSRWPNGGSPSVASGYQGCYVTPTYNWMSYKRTNFTSAIYQIDIPAHDDYAYLYINGALVFQHLSCCDAHTNVWTGPLGPSDQVEFRVIQGTSGSSGAITLTTVTPTTLTSGAIGPSQTICAGNTPPTPMSQTSAPSGGCFLDKYQWQYSQDNGSSWTNISGAVASGYTIPGSIYTQTLYRRIVYDVCGNSAASMPDTVYMDNTAPGSPAVYGNNTWNVYCFQDANYSIYAGYYTEPSLTFLTSSRYSTTAPPSAASGYQGCQLINTYYSVSMKRTGFTAGTYQIDITADDDYTSIYINGTLVSSLTYPTLQNNVWTGALGPSDQIEIRWRNNAGPGQTGVRFTTVTPSALTPGSISAYNPSLCTGDVPIINNTAKGSGGCYINYSWQSSIDGGSTWSTISGATDTNYTASVSPTVPTQFRRVATDICGNTAYTAAVTFTPGGGAVGNPSVYGNGSWNVYCYSVNGAAFSTATYMGYYTEPLLSFNSVNRWSSAGSPSSASGYQGCQISADYHWVSYRRTNFTPGTYQLDIPYHDDDVFLFINGVQVFTHTGCCDAHVNAWTGSLGASDLVELRWHEYNGGSSGALNVNLVSVSTALTGGSIGSDQTICSNSVPTVLTNVDSAHSGCYITYQWQSSTGCSGTWSNIAGATGLIYTPPALTANTCFRRMAANACGNTAYSNTVTISIYNITLTPGSIAANQTICSSAVPAALTSTGLPSGGDGNYVYQWQSSPDGASWTNIAGATATSYAPAALTTTTYYRRNVSACAGASSASSAAIIITVNQPPVITLQPANTSVCTGGNTSFSTTASGTGLSWQWQVNTGSSWTNLSNIGVYSGAATATLGITGATAGMNGFQYRVAISGSCTPSVTSNAVTLSIGTSPSISSQPSSITACVGATTGFNISAPGSGLSYQWQQKIGSGSFTSLSNTGIYSGTNTPSLILTGVTAGMTGYQYQCIVTSSCGGSTTSSIAVLTVVAAISNTITADQSVCSGLNAATLSGSSSGTYSYQWQSSTVSASTGFANASGTSTAYNYNPNPISSTTWYRRLVSNTGCSSTSNVVTITQSPLTIAVSAQPVDQAICAGANASFSVTASGPGTLSYQWYEYNGSAWTALSNTGIYSGATSASLSITGPGSSMNGYRYYARIFASGCTANSLNSNYATLTTNNYPVITYSNPDITTCSGANITINCTATGTGLSYQWQQNTGSGWNNLPNYGNFANVTTNSLHIYAASTALNGSQYRCVVSGSCAPGPATSGTTNLTVNPPISGNSVSSSQTLCAGTPVPFTSSTPSGGDGSYTYQWTQNTGSGYTAIPGATGISYAPGTLSQTTQFIRVVYDGACAANSSIAVTITITPPTTIASDPANAAVCAGTNAVFSVLATGTSPAYQWQVNTGSGSFNNIVNNAQYSGATSANLNVLNPAYALNGYQYRCVVTGNCAPASVTSNPASLTVNPVASISSQPANVNSCSGSNTSFHVTASGSPLSFQWMEKQGSGAFAPVSDGGIYSGSQTATLTLSGIGTAINNWQYYCIVTQAACPINSSTASLTVNQQPALVITDPATVCYPATVNITAPAVTAGSSLAGGPLTYWKDAAASISQAGPSSIAVSGTYFIRVASSTVCYDIKPVHVSIDPIPVLVITNPPADCAPATVDLTAPAVTAGSSSGLSYTYFSDAAATTPLANPHAIAAGGTYYIKGSTAGGCYSIAPVSVTINTPPTAAISYTGSPYCATGTATPTQTGSTGGTYTSTTGLTIDNTTGAIDLAASTPGSYTITYTFTDGTCPNTTTTTITINALPTASISYTGSPYCATGTATPTQTGTSGGTYSSTTGLTIDNTTGSIDLAASTAGTYTVTYSFTNGTCPNLTTTTITINALPTASISYAGSPYCATGTATPTQTGSTGGTYTSTTGLTIDNITGAIDLAASTPGSYSITYTFTDGTCPNTTTTSITINSLPTAAISYAASPYCATGTASPTQTGPGSGTYSSSTGLMINSSTGAIDLAASTAGTYTVTYSFTNGTCPNTTTTTITINALPTASISYAGSPYCATGTATPTQTGTSGGTYSSTTGLTIDNTTGSIDLAASTPGTYTVTYSFTNGTCPNTTTTSITINALPTASISYSGSPYCATGTATPTQAGPTGGTYTSTTGLTINNSTGAIDLAASTPGTYTISYSFTNGSCSNTTSTSILIRRPSLSTTDPAAVCLPATIDLTNPAVTTGSDPGLSFQYYSDAAGSSVLTNPNAVYTSGTYYIQATSTSTGCSSLILPVTATLNSPPSLSISGNTDVCKGSPDTLTASAPGSSIQWPGFGSGASIITTPMSNTVYTAIATNAPGCSDTASISVQVRPFGLKLSASQDPILSGNSVTLSSSAGFPYQVLEWWPLNTFSDQSALSQTIIVHDTAHAFYVVAQSYQGCLDTARLDVQVDVNMKDFFIPNAFTPNNDGKNDLFKVYGSSIRSLELRVFSQWGGLIFESRDPQRGWDGTVGGRPAPVGIYVYAVKVIFTNDKTITRKGTVSLIR